MDDDAPRYASLGDYLQLLRKQWPLIVIPVVLAVGAALFFSSREAKTYQAQAQVLIQNETQQLTLLGASVLPNSSPSSSPEIVAQTIDTPSLAAVVRRRLRTRASVGALQGDVSLSVDSSSGLLDVTSTTGSAAFSAALANAYADEIARRTTATARGNFAAASRALQKRLNRLNPREIGNAGERFNLLDEITRLDFLRTTSTPGQVAKVAGIPSSPASPKPTRDAALGLLAGLLLGVIFAFTRDAFDRRLRGSAEIAAELDYRLVGQVRSETMGRAVQPSAVADKNTAGDVETFRILRNNLELLATDTDKRVFLVTSALPQEGKSTVAASLALAAAAAGRRTLLVDADLRRPSLAKRLGVSAAPGLSDYLKGSAEPEEILRSIPVMAPGYANGASGSEAGADAVSGTLVLLPAGDPSGASTELLASERMRALIEQVVGVYELVIVDSAPLLPVADTLQLVPLMGGVLLCVKSGRTTREQARAARRALSQVSLNAIGVVVTDLRARDEPAGYGLYPYYYSDAERVGS